MKNFISILLLAILVTGTTACSSKKMAANKEKRYLNKNYKALKKDVVGGEVVRLEDTIKVIFPDNLMFALGSHTILKSTEPLFVRMSHTINKFDKTKILIIGHCDSTGDEAKNQVLSEKRSESAKKLLVENKVEDARLLTWGMGSKDPVRSNATAEGRAKNRRVEFIVLYKDKVK